MIASENEWDWLGPGIYFWEQNPGRALEYAIESASGNQKNKVPIKNPFVIGSIIELGNCLNLMEATSISIMQETYRSLEKVISEARKTMPENKGANRKLDCAVIKYVHQSSKKLGLAAYDTVRSSFLEGKPIYPGSNFTDRLHIEICVLNTELIKGYFLPLPVDEFNPYLRKEFI